MLSIIIIKALYHIGNDPTYSLITSFLFSWLLNSRDITLWYLRSFPFVTWPADSLPSTLWPLWSLEHNSNFYFMFLQVVSPPSPSPTNPCLYWVLFVDLLFIYANPSIPNSSSASLMKLFHPKPPVNLSKHATAHSAFIQLNA